MMEDVICPECGELNSTDDYFCRRCFALLPPLSLEQADNDHAPSEKEEPETPAENFYQKSGAPDENDETQPVPEWLAEILSSDQDLPPTVNLGEETGIITTPEESDFQFVPTFDTFGEKSEFTQQEEIDHSDEAAVDEPVSDRPAFRERQFEPFDGMDYYQDWQGELEGKRVNEPPVEDEVQATEQPEEPLALEKPEWLIAMESGGSLGKTTASSEDGASGAELSGPLAGLVGALPAEPDTIRSITPSSFSLKLRATDAQQTNAALLRQLIQMEGKSKPATGPAPRHSQKLLRLIISITLFSAALYAILSNTTALFPSLTGDMAHLAYQVVETVQIEKPVLIVVDYSPAYTSEIGASLSTVIARLLARGSYLVFVSTNPTGPIQTQTIIEELENRAGKPVEHTNLGFLSGQALGIRAFAKNPRQTLPFEILSQPAWKTAQLRNVTSISGFGAVIVATENPDSAINWIEQAQPLMKDTPLLMLVSAQIEPVIRPYFDTSPRRVKALIVGLVNAVQYEKMSGQDLITRTLWGPVAFTLSIAVLLILLVIFFDSMSIIQAQSRLKSKKEAGK